MEKKIEKTKLNIEQLNMEQVATKTATNSNKEEKNMKGRKFLVLLTTIILVASMMVACGSDTSANQSASNKDNDQDEIQVEDPVEDETDVAAPDEDETDVTVPDEDETTPDEDVADPEPVEEDFDVHTAYDFSAFNENPSLDIYHDIVDTITYDKTLFIIRNLVDGHKVDGVLVDGDEYYVSADDATHIFYYFYFPKDVETVEVDGMDYYDQNTKTYLFIEEENGKYGYSANVRDASIITEDGYDLTGHVVYTDGTEETITITLYPAEE